MTLYELTIFYSRVRRKNLFRTNVMFIEDHNQKAENGAYRYTLGINRFADLVSVREENTSDLCTSSNIFSHRVSLYLFS